MELFLISRFLNLTPPDCCFSLTRLSEISIAWKKESAESWYTYTQNNKNGFSRFGHRETSSYIFLCLTLSIYDSLCKFLIDLSQIIYASRIREGRWNLGYYGYLVSMVICDWYVNKYGGLVQSLEMNMSVT